MVQRSGECGTRSGVLGGKCGLVFEKNGLKYVFENMVDLLVAGS